MLKKLQRFPESFCMGPLFFDRFICIRKNEENTHSQLARICQWQYKAKNTLFNVVFSLVCNFFRWQLHSASDVNMKEYLMMLYRCNIEYFFLQFCIEFQLTQEFCYSCYNFFLYKFHVTLNFCSLCIHVCPIQWNKLNSYVI